MRTAIEIWEEENVLWETTMGGSLEDHIRHAINKGRIEAINECNKLVHIKYENCGDIKMCGCQGVCERPIAFVDNQSILKLIDQVK